MLKNKTLELSKREINKLISYVDRYFTYDEKDKSKEGDDALFKAHDFKRKIYVSIRKGAYGIYASIIKEDEPIFSACFHNFKEIKTFKTLIRYMGSLHKPLIGKNELLKLVENGQTIEYEKDHIYFRIIPEKNNYSVYSKVLSPFYWDNWNKIDNLNKEEAISFILYLTNDGWDVYTS